MSMSIINSSHQEVKSSTLNDNNQSDLIFEVNETSKRLFDAEKLRKRREERAKERVQNEIKDCTFAPKINATRKKKASTSQIPRIPVGERLYNRAKKTMLLKQELKQKRLEEEKSFLTFKPKIISKTSSNDSKVFDRLSRSNKQQRIRELRKLREEKELEGCTFAPKLSTKAQNYDKRNSIDRDSLEQSRSYSSLSRSDSSVFERLSLDNNLRATKQKQLKKESIEAELKGCTFDARKTIDNIRKEQHEHKKLLQKNRLEVQVNMRGKIAAPKSSFETGPSCFQQALKLVRFSATTLSTPPKYEQLKDETNQENCASIQNIA